MAWKPGTSGNPNGRPAGARGRYVLADVVDRLDKIGSDMRVIKKAFTYDQPPLSWAGDLRRIHDNGSPPEGSSLTKMAGAPLPEEQRDGYLVEFRGEPRFEYFAEMVDGCFTVYRRTPGNGESDTDVSEYSGGRGFEVARGAAAQKGPAGSAQSEQPIGTAYTDAATRNKMAPRRHVLFPGGQVPKAVANTLAKIRASDDASKKRAADVAAFYSGEK